MNYIDILEANALIHKIDFKGKEYGEVSERIKGFRYLYPQGGIETDVISNENGVCVFKATVKDEYGRILGTGTAYEKEGSSFINKTSYIENCETSAVGRALSMAGFSIGTTIMSYEEIENATLNQELMTLINETQLKTLQGLIKQCEEKKITYEEILKQYDVKELKELNCKQYGELLLSFKDKFKENNDDK